MYLCRIHAVFCSYAKINIIFLNAVPFYFNIKNDMINLKLSL